MPSSLTDNPELFTASISIPTSSEARTIASLTPAFQASGDRTAYLRKRWSQEFAAPAVWSSSVDSTSSIHSTTVTTFTRNTNGVQTANGQLTISAGDTLELTGQIMAGMSAAGVIGSLKWQLNEEATPANVIVDMPTSIRHINAVGPLVVPFQARVTIPGGTVTKLAIASLYYRVASGTMNLWPGGEVLIRKIRV